MAGLCVVVVVVYVAGLCAVVFVVLSIRQVSALLLFSMRQVSALFEVRVTGRYVVVVVYIAGFCVVVVVVYVADLYVLAVAYLVFSRSLC